MTHTDLVTVGKFMYVWEAYLAKAFLEDQGIPCFIVDDNIVTVDPFASVAYGGVKVQVRRGNAEKASLLIRAYESRSPDDLASEEVAPPKKTWPGVAMVLGATIVVLAALDLIFGRSTLADAWIWLVIGGIAWALGRHYPK